MTLEETIRKLADKGELVSLKVSSVSHRRGLREFEARFSPASSLNTFTGNDRDPVKALQKAIDASKRRPRPTDEEEFG